MNVRWQDNTFVRHEKDESVVWHPRSEGCTVLKDAKTILREIMCGWRDDYTIITAVAKKFECQTDVIANDVRMVLDELIGQGFVECAGGDGKSMHGGANNAVLRSDEREGGSLDDDSALEDFCKRHDIPEELHIDLTDACTERCVHCYVPQEQRDFLPYDMAEKALREFRAMNGLSVHLTGGECMMHHDFVRICRLCKELNLNMIVFSNLTLCDEKMVAAMREVDPQFINVSLYAMIPEVHDAITRIPGSWQRTMDALLRCEKAGVHCRIATPLLKENKGEFAALKAFADEHRTHLVPSYDIIAKSNHDCSNLCHACSVEEIQEVLERNSDIFGKVWNREMPSPDRKVCDIGAARLYLNAKGNYYPCDSMHEYVLGNVRTHTVGEIWRGEKLEYLRSLKNRDFGACASCEHRPFCKVCPAFNFNATGDLFRTIPEKCALSAVVHGVYGGR